MNRLRLGKLISLLTVTSASSDAQRPATVTISGVVTDSSGTPVAFATIFLPDRRRVVADPVGRFTLQTDSSTRSIEIRRIAFEPRTLTAESWPDTGLRIVLVPLYSTLERVRVEATQRIRSLALHGFYEREAELAKGINHGFVITGEEIEQRKGGRPTDFLFGHPGVTVKLVREAGRGGRTGLQPQGSGGCRLEIYVAGIRFYPRPPSEPLRRGQINFIDDLLNITEIAAMEVYPRAVGAPPKYQAFNGSCGVMLIWTK